MAAQPFSLKDAPYRRNVNHEPVANKHLVLHGLKPREEVLRPLVEAQFCPKCSQENAPIAVYCVK
jgi:hypothetical protein